MTALQWDPNAQLIVRPERVLVLAHGGRSCHVVFGIRGQLLARCWRGQGPDPEITQWFLRSSGQLVHPVWHELLTQLAALGVVHTQSAVMPIAPVWHSRVAGLRWLFAVGVRRNLRTASAWLYLGLSVAAVMAAGVLVHLSRRPVAPRLEQTLWYEFLVHPEFLVTAVSAAAAMFTVVQWALARRLAALLAPVPTGAIALLPYPHLAARRELVYALTPRERASVGGPLLLLQALVSLVVVGASIVWPSAALAGAAFGVWVVAVLDLYPLWRSHGAMLWESALGVEDFARACLDNFVFQWLPSSYQSNALRSLRDIRSYRIGVVALASLSFIFYVAGEIFDAVMGSPGLHPKASLARMIWFVLASLMAAGIAASWTAALGVIVRRWFLLGRPGAIHALRLSPERRAQAAKLLRETALLAEMPVKLVDQLLDSAQAYVVKNGAVLMSEGDLGDSFWFIVEGQVAIEKARAEAGPLHLATLGAGAGIGEIALLENVRRTATVRALAPGLVLKLPGTAFAQWMSTAGMDAQTLRYRVRVGQVVNSAPFFAGLPRGLGADLVRCGRPQRVAAGSEFVRHGDAGVRMWIVLDGAVSVSRQGQELARLGQGNVVGEMALLSGNPRSADVTAVGEALLLEITAQDFWAMLTKYPALREAAEQQSHRRQRSS